MREIRAALKLKSSFGVTNVANLPSCFAVSDLAAHSIGAVGCAISVLADSLRLSKGSQPVFVDQTLASLWFMQSIRPVAWSLPPVWDAISGDYPTKDGWIRLHTNLDHHRHAALFVLNCKADRQIVEKRVAAWDSIDLETAIVEVGGVAAAMRSRQDWLNHPQGRAITAEPLIDWGRAKQGCVRTWSATKEQPLKGLKVLDLTRVLAGPVSTRTLAGFGAQVLRIDPPDWDEANVVPDITLGKRCATLDLQTPKDRERFELLLSQADILIHGYRPGALDSLGYGQEKRLEIADKLVEVSLDAYGWTGPWCTRRGFDSLVQMSSGIAHSGQRWAQSEAPKPLPVQALDHATGYLMTAAAIRALDFAVNNEEIVCARLSLARTAELLFANPQASEVKAKTIQAKPQHYSKRLEMTPWGEAQRLNPALNIEGTPMKWMLPASELGSDLPVWKE